MFISELLDTYTLHLDHILFTYIGYKTEGILSISQHVEVVHLL